MNYPECLPENIAEKLRNVDGVTEVRLRDGQAVIVNFGGRRYYLCDGGFTRQISGAFIFEGSCDEVIRRACGGSVYAYETMLADGFFTLSDGTRVGVAGDYVKANGVFQSFTSLCFRVPHELRFPDVSVLAELYASGGSVVFVGPPSSGKTTALKSFASYLSERVDVVVADERHELSANNFTADCDVIRGADKRYAFEVAVRSLSPKWVICDEVTNADLPYVCDCVNSGVNVACSVHGTSKEDIEKRFGDKFSCFTKAVILDKRHSVQVVDLQKTPTMTKSKEI